MTKAELLSAIAKKGGYTKKDAEKALEAVIHSNRHTGKGRKGFYFRLRFF